MVAFTSPPPERKCFKCKNAQGVYLLSDPKLTKGVMERFCRDCYKKLFVKEKE